MIIFNFFFSVDPDGDVNKLGGIYHNGRPLSYDTQKKIVEHLQSSKRSTYISHNLKVSDGGVSKNSSRFKRTGYFAPGKQGGGGPRSTAQSALIYQQQTYSKQPAKHPLSHPDVQIEVLYLSVKSSKSRPIFIQRSSNNFPHTQHPPTRVQQPENQSPDVKNNEDLPSQVPPALIPVAQVEHQPTLTPSFSSHQVIDIKVNDQSTASSTNVARNGDLGRK